MRSKKFKIQELVPLAIYNELHEDVLWDMLDNGLLETIDTLKEVFSKGSMTINNWLWSGDRGFSGLRNKSSKWYSPTSQHSLGKAIDCVFSDYTAKEVRDFILINPEMFPHVGALEMGVSWLHVDVRPRINNKIYKFYNKG